MSSPEAENVERLEAVPANIRKRIEQEREVQARAMGQFLRPVLERLNQLERQFGGNDTHVDKADRFTPEQKVSIERQADLLAGVITPWARRIVALEERLDALPEPTPPTLKGLDQAGLGRLATLERRFAELERRGVDYCGVWKADRSYRVGELVTCKGSLWACVEPADPGEKPGEGLPWKLCVKAGRDGRDLRGTAKGGNRDE